MTSEPGSLESEAGELTEDEAPARLRKPLRWRRVRAMLSVRLALPEWQMLRRVMADHDVTASMIVRLGIRRVFADFYPGAAPPRGTLDGEEAA